MCLYQPVVFYLYVEELWAALISHLCYLEARARAFMSSCAGPPSDTPGAGRSSQICVLEEKSLNDHTEFCNFSGIDYSKCRFEDSATALPVSQRAVLGFQSCIKSVLRQTIYVQSGSNCR